MDIPLVRLSAVLHAPLVDRSGDRLGRVDDVIVGLSDGEYPPVTGLKAQLGGRDVFVPVARVASIGPEGAQLVGEELDLGRFERREGEVLLREDILGRRVVNVVGAHLVRADDLVLGRVEGWWRLLGVDTSFRSLLVRLLPVRVRKRVPVRPFLDWASVEPFVSHVPTARLRMRFGRLSKLHPAQIADLVEAASHDEGEEIIEAVQADRELEADVFEELDPEHQVEFLRERSDTEAAKVLATMEPDDAADLLGELDQERREPVLKLLPWRQQRKVRTLLGYHPATAGGLMSPDFVALPEASTVRHAFEALRESNFPEETIATVFTLDQDQRLAGVASVVMLLKHGLDETLAGVASPPPLVFSAGDELAEIAVRMADYDLTVVPVVDDAGVLLGIVTVDDLLEMMIPDDWRRRLAAISNE